jgi:molybdopterin molybdotransferase
MLSVEEARARLLDGLQPVGEEVVPLAEAWGRITAAPVAARLDQPPQDISAMDGYAVCASDAVTGARLAVVGTAPTGHPWSGTLAPGEALRLFTGSIMPPGADAVLMQENACRDGEHVVVREGIARGRHIRRRGLDFCRDDVLLPAGRKLTARDIGLAAAGNHPWLRVHRRPRVAILATGDEIALPGEPIPPGGIVSSNAHALAALVRACGAEPMVLPVVADDAPAIAAAARSADGADLLLTTGGASVGEHDLVQAGLGIGGLTVDFWKVAMRPGKPFMFGRLGELPVLGLPGNPVSALVCAVLFAVPVLARLAGAATTQPPSESAILGAPLPANDHRADHLRATLTEAEAGDLPVATAFERQDSAMLRLLAKADALILRPPGAAAAAAGARVQVIRLAALGL